MRRVTRFEILVRVEYVSVGKMSQSWVSVVAV
jgi:hypothetical protein